MNLLLSLDKSILDIICLHSIRVVENYNFLIASSRFLPFHLPELLEFWVKSICSFCHCDHVAIVHSSQ